MPIELLSPAERRAERAEHFPAFSGTKLLHIKRSVAEILRQIGGNGIFDQYTKHDISHIDEMLQLLNWIIPKDTQSQLSTADWLMTVLAIYFHDLAMLVTKEEFARRHQSGFNDFVTHNLFSGDQGLDYRERINLLTDDERDRFLYQEFVRHKHAERIRYWISGQARSSLGIADDIVAEIDELFRHLDPVFRRDLGIICESHHLDDLGDSSKYKVRQPYGSTSDETANLQYCAVLLRTADLLHITRDRTPSLAFRLLNPADPISQREWAKQMAVRSIQPQLGRDKDGNISQIAPQDTIDVYAYFSSPPGFFGLTSYLTYCQAQLRKSFSWIEASQRTQGVGVAFPWRHIDLTHIETEGFLSQPFQFTIDQAKILDLLTGHTLYNDSTVVIRELLQNAIDAVRLQCAIDRVSPDEYGRIEIHWDSDNSVFSIQDNGTGMSQVIIENHLLKVGSSRYQDPDFKKLYPDFCPISRFGIGILSTFMIADSVDIITSHIDDEKARHLSLKSVNGQYLISVMDKQESPLARSLGKHGTRIELHVRPSAKLDNPLEVTQKWVVVPNCQIHFRQDVGERVLIGFRSVRDALAEVLEREDHKVVSTNVRPRHGDVFIREMEDRACGVTLAFATVWDSHFQEWEFLAADRSKSEDEERSLVSCTCVEGIRVLIGSPGFDRDFVYAIANATGAVAPRTNVARSDLEDTPEFEAMIVSVYKLYCEHVKGEVDAQCSERECSLTWAVQEAGILLENIIGPYDPAPTHLDLALKAAADVVPLLLIEEDDKRRAVSLTEFRSLPHFRTVHGPLFRSAEQLLREIPSTSSLRGLIGMLAGGRVSLPSGPLLCGNDDFSNSMLDSAFDGKEPVRFDFNHAQRRLDVHWENTTAEKRWVRLPDPSGFIGKVEWRSRYYEEIPYQPLYFGAWICNGPLVQQGALGDKIVRVGNRTFVLPDTMIASFLLRVHNVFAECGNDRQRMLLFDLLIQFERSALDEEDGVRDLKRFYDDKCKELTGSMPLKIALGAIKDTKGKTFDTRVWSRELSEE